MSWAVPSFDFYAGDTNDPFPSRSFGLEEGSTFFRCVGPRLVVINMRVADSLRLIVPSSLLAVADGVNE
jgi:hypothetical protein